MINQSQVELQPVRVNQPGKPKVVEEDDPTLKKEVDGVSFFSLFRFADGYDKFLMTAGSIAAAATGAAIPAFSLLWGNMTDSFGESSSNPDIMVEKAKQVMFNFLEIGAGIFCASWIMFACWMVAGERQAIRCRKQYLKSLLQQEIGWFDRVNQTEIASRFASETLAFQGAIGQKVATFIMTLATFVSGFVIAYVKGWKLSLVITATLPALAIGGIIYMNIIQDKDKKLQASYAEAGGHAEQAIAAIKTVKSLTGEAYEGEMFSTSLEAAAKKTAMSTVWAGVGIGFIFFIMFSSYALGFWYGGKLITDREMNNSGTIYSAGDVIVVFFCILTSGFNISQITPCIKKFAEGQQAAAKIFAVLDRETKIPNNPDGKVIKDSEFKGKIELKNVSFAYPKDPSRKVLNNVSLVFEPNQKSGLVGESGCGKSTIMQLLMRFYDPLQGSIELDGVDIRQLKLEWLRENIGYVGQEPVLFATSIRENLLLGKPGCTDEDMIKALRRANAQEFVMHLENKLDTYVGHGGGQLSGGQKQRIAIARAILKNPRILLLDEATSALDNKNEREIQATLDSIASQRTTISIAHRVGTIRNSNKIFVIDKGELKQQGVFRELRRFAGYTESDFDKEVDMPARKVSELQLDVVEGKEDVKSKGLTKEDKDKQHQEELLKKYGDTTFGRLFKYNSADMGVLVVGVLVALIHGTIFPIFSIFLARMVQVLTYLQIGYGATRQADANLQALIFLLIGIAAFFVVTAQTAIFGLVGDRLTRKLREDCYKKILKMPVPWFDHPRNNAGSLSARLATDCQTVNGLTSTLVGITIQNVSCLLTGLIIAFVYEWRTTLVTLGMIPFMIGAGLVQTKFQVGFSEQTDEAYKDSANLIMEAMVNIRTVTSFGVESSVAKKYGEKLQQPYQLAKKKGNISGLLFGLSQLVMYVVFAVIFYIGTLFVRDVPLKFIDVFTAIYAIVFAAMTAGNNSQFAPDVAAAKNSAANLFSILDEEDEDQIQEKRESPKIQTGGNRGEIRIENISFKYPGRGNNTFEKLSLNIGAGQKVALVGASGCGKSTIIQMLLRFYEPNEGKIYLDGQDIRDYELHYLRRLFGVVSQEPVLFNASFRDNIKYNLDATDDQIKNAAQKANALSFIVGAEVLAGEVQKKEGLQDAKPAAEPEPKEEAPKTGLDRGVGVKGSQISGGQKQRVAIARSIMRNPSILLLDEATSALDKDNEKKVQDSLDKIMGEKTTVTVAHRFDTIKNSNKIYVFQEGKIVENGTYDQLIRRKGHFFRMNAH